jgi:hypothetical protein
LKAQLAAAGQAQAGVCVKSQRSVRGGDDQPAGHTEMNNPLGAGLAGFLIQRAGAGSAQFADDMLSSAMHGQNCAAFKAFGLTRRRRFEGLGVRTEPDFDNTVAAETLVHTTSNGLDLR